MTLIVAALTCFACMSFSAPPDINQPTGIQTTSQVERPDDITFDYAVTGIMHGNYSVGIGNPGPNAPLWGVDPPAGTTNCSNWIFHSPNVHVVCPDECKNCVRGTITLVYRPQAGGDWFAYSSTSYGQMDTSHCCSQAPPQHCNGIWDVGVVRPPTNPCQ